jgi:PAS domain S-box-containing protein
MAEPAIRLPVLATNTDSCIRHPPSLVRRLLPSLVILVVLPLCVVVALMVHQHQQRMSELIAEDADEITNNLAMILKLQTAGLATALQPIVGDAGVQAALATGNTEGLLAAWQPVFAAMQRDNHISHMYFSDRTRTCLLRVHAPGQHGDRIDRHSTLEAERTGKLASGLELGMRGTFTLRVVQPVIKEGRVIGYIELGKEIEDALLTLRRHIKEWNQMAIILLKDRVDRQAWEEAQLRLGREGDWERLLNHIIVLATQGHLPDAFAAWADEIPRSYKRDAEMRDAGRLWRITATPLHDSSGSDIGHVLAMRDITDERRSLWWQLAMGGSAALTLGLVLAFVHRLLARADRRIAEQQASLRDERWRLGSIIEATRAGTWEWDVLTGAIVVSERWADMLGYNCHDLGRLDRAAWERLFHPDDLPTAKDLMHRNLSGEMPFLDHECRLQHKDGHWVWIHCRGRILTRTEVGAPRLMFGTHSDVSKRKQAEEQTLKLQQAKLALELGEMVHANRLVALGTLMAGLAHEFNHPAQVVLLNQKSLRSMVEACAETAKAMQGPAVGLLTWSEVAVIAPQLLDDMELATTQLSELIENVQNYARPNEGMCRTVTYDMLTSVARSSQQLVASYARRRQVALVNDVESAGGTQAGCGCLQQVVVNLLINAIQATPAGGIVSIACQRQDGRIGLIISDTGPGIDPAVLAKLGQPFVTTRKEQGGNGLGLFICL